MNKIIVIPDIHGRKFWKKVENSDPSIPIIFLGDYSDPYEDEKITHLETIENLKEIIQFAKSRNNIILLFGNHDLHYVDSGVFYPCSRYSTEHYKQYNKLYHENFNMFKIAHQFNNYIFTHAGITKQWLTYNIPQVPIEKLAEELNTNLNNRPRIFYQISYFRGGYNDAGSPIWADIQEFSTANLPALGKMIQVFGHTQFKNNPHILPTYWCLDCRKVFIINNDELKEY